MAGLGNNYFTTVPQRSTSESVHCIIYTGPSIGEKPNIIRNQDTISLAILKLVSMIKKQETRITKLE